jgi:hypothetical protein
MEMVAILLAASKPQSDIESMGHNDRKRRHSFLNQRSALYPFSGSFAILFFLQNYPAKTKEHFHGSAADSQRTTAGRYG